MSTANDAADFLNGGLMTKYREILRLKHLGFSERKSVYAAQTGKAQASGKSNCPYCAMSENANRNKIWKLAEMDADHVTAWSKGGATDRANCEMLCKSHNRAKGNR